VQEAQPKFIIVTVKGNQVKINVEDIGQYANKVPDSAKAYIVMHAGR